MKSLIFLLLAALVAVSNSAVAKAPAGRANLNVGYIYQGDRLLHRGYLNRQGIPNTIQYQDLVYRGNSTTRISAIQAYEVGVTQFGSPRIIQGGVGSSNVTVRVTSARGYGYYYTVDIWGRYR